MSPERNSCPRRWSFQRAVSRLRRDRSGLSAIEFAFVGAPFFILLIGILEICLIFLVSTILDYGAREAARTIRTGAFQTGGSSTAAQFRTDICANMADLFDCSTRIQVDVRRVTAFPTVQDAVPLDGLGNLNTAGFVFNPGVRDDIIIVTVYYEWPLITPVISNAMANMPNGRRLLVSSQAFRNEPF